MQASPKRRRDSAGETEPAESVKPAADVAEPSAKKQRGLKAKLATEKPAAEKPVAPSTNGAFSCVCLLLCRTQFSCSLRNPFPFLCAGFKASAAAYDDDGKWHDMDKVDTVKDSTPAASGSVTTDLFAKPKGADAKSNKGKPAVPPAIATRPILPDNDDDLFYDT